MSLNDADIANEVTLSRDWLEAVAAGPHPEGVKSSIMSERHLRCWYGKTSSAGIPWRAVSYDQPG